MIKSNIKFIYYKIVCSKLVRGINKVLMKTLFRKKFERKMDETIKRLYDIFYGVPQKVIDPFLDEYKDEIRKRADYLLKEGKINYAQRQEMEMAITHHEYMDKAFEDALIKSMEEKEPNVEETQNAICEALENNMKE